MKQIETLHLIRARCVELLEQAKLRTPGTWRVYDSGRTLSLPGIDAGNKSIVIFGVLGDQCGIQTGMADATYIANASVAFEAALESTVAAVNDILDYPDLHSGTDMEARIITAWKHLLP